MYKHLTPQEIEEFEKEFWRRNYWAFENGDEKPILSFIDTLIGKRVGEIAERVEKLQKHYGNPKGDVMVYNKDLLDVLSLLSPDSPKRNEE